MLTDDGADPIITNSIMGTETYTGSTLNVQYIREVPTDLPEPTLLNNLFCPSSTTGELDPSNLCIEPLFAQVDSAGTPTDAHLSLQSELIDAGHASLLDPDGSPSDIGSYGGPGAARWDLDADGIPAWYWPSTQSQPPPGVDPSLFDCDDLNPLVGTECMRP